MLIRGKMLGNSSEGSKAKWHVVRKLNIKEETYFRCAYPVPNVEPSKRNHKENSRPSVLASNYENAKQSSVH